MKEDDFIMNDLDKVNLSYEFNKKADEYKEELIKSIRRLVKINSVEGKKLDNAPFGIGPKEALKEALRISEELGFKTKNIENAIGYAEYGESDDYIGIIGHVDIVPEGDGWNYNPFDVSIDNEKIYGRGVLDNKGPIMAVLYGMKIIKDLNLPISKKIRVIFGTNEETGFCDIPYYLKEEKPPIMGFTPDCKYPAVYGERGILDLTIWSKKIENINIKSIKGNFKNNIVPDFAEIEFYNNVNKYDETKTISAKGKQAPGNAPESGINAVTKLCKDILEANDFINDKEILDFIKFIYKSFYENYSLSKLNINCSDEISGDLVINPYEIKMDNGKIGISVVFRYPISYKYEDMISIIRSIIKEGYTLSENRRMDSVCFDKDSDLLKKLKEAYEDVTGLDGTPVTTTGGTYAKVFPNIVAFGPSFPGQKGIAHNSDEYMYIEDLITNLRIYTNALYNLAK
ncbi:Sapep family Mn(2+)-dependent dipeptidase [Clostridium baratii]|uniref:Sapep family Mn(2+)-dependent dipeptidase n=1 Tax=Clostridium baratii TaxID=1561 RepID=UPI001CAF6267|nr:Sapep family Mn(2+)-dependent dipeptidase [Clostridium baratii]STA98755.1 dipeptidase PepV [Clostridium baratii]